MGSSSTDRPGLVWSNDRRVAWAARTSPRDALRRGHPAGALPARLDGLVGRSVRQRRIRDVRRARNRACLYAVPAARTVAAGGELGRAACGAHRYRLHAGASPRHRAGDHLSAADPDRGDDRRLSPLQRLYPADPRTADPAPRGLAVPDLSDLYRGARSRRVLAAPAAAPAALVVGPAQPASRPTPDDAVGG